MASKEGNRSMRSAAGGSSIAAPARPSPTDAAADASGQLQSLMAKTKVPAYVKQMVELLMATRQEMQEVIKRNMELLEEVRLLREENISLKAQLANVEVSKPTSAVGTSELRPSPDFGKVDYEIDRSIVLSHVPESSSSKSSERLTYDFAYVVGLLDFLGIECTPTSVYRMGRIEQNKPRLIKVVLPASKFQRIAVRRAPRLRFSSAHKGVYLRPSLTWEERMRRREQRKATGEVGDGSSMRATQARDGWSSPLSHSSPPASRFTSTPVNSGPTGNC